MKDLVNRVEAIFGELGFKVYDVESDEEIYEASFSRDNHFYGYLFIEKDNNFLELGYSYSFDIRDEELLRKNIEEIMNICYKYGSYFNVVKDEDEISLSVFSKIYYSGLNVESLEDTLDDFISCNEEISAVFDLHEENGDEGLSSEEI